MKTKRQTKLRKNLILETAKGIMEEPFQLVAEFN